MKYDQTLVSRRLISKLGLTAGPLDEDSMVTPIQTWNRSMTMELLDGFHHGCGQDEKREWISGEVLRLHDVTRNTIWNCTHQVYVKTVKRVGRISLPGYPLSLKYRLPTLYVHATGGKMDTTSGRSSGLHALVISSSLSLLVQTAYIWYPYSRRWNSPELLDYFPKR